MAVWRRDDHLVPRDPPISRVASYPSVVVLVIAVMVRSISSDMIINQIHSNVSQQTLHTRKRIVQIVCKILLVFQNYQTSTSYVLSAIRVCIVLVVD